MSRSACGPARGASGVAHATRPGSRLILFGGLKSRGGSQLWLLWLAATLLFASGLRADQFDPLRSYWWNQLVGANLSANTLAGRANTASNYWSTLLTNSTRTTLWSDLPLGSNSSNMGECFDRLYAMALAWASPGCSLQGDPYLATAITNSLDWMCANVYTTTAKEYDNWWWWEIGGLHSLNNTAVLMYPALTGTQITNYNASVDHFQPPNKAWKTGANLTDQCLGMIIRGILGRNSAKMVNAQTNLSPVFRYVTTGDGFYRDGSFVFHTKNPYTAAYGLTTVNDVALLVNLLNGSAWQITDPNLTNVFNWVPQTYEPVCYNGEWMAMVCGRTISRGPASTSGQGFVNPILPFAPPAAAMAMTAWAADPVMPPGQYHFPSMDCVVGWRKNFCLAVRMSSSRIYSYESINGENLHGWFTGDGMTYLYLGDPDTQFTGDFWPTVDPYHLPGTTVQTGTRANAAGAGQTTGQPWVGGAQVAGSYGSVGMSLAAVGTTLTGKKSWFMFDNEVVCLGAGITCGDAAEVDTTVEDRRLGTAPANNFILDGVTNPPVMGWVSNPATVSWCALDGVGGYYFPSGATHLRAAFTARTGQWGDLTTTPINTNAYTDDYLTLWFNHGIKPTNSSYAYVLLPNYSAPAMAAYAANPAVVILTNTTTVQAASKPSLGVVAANFWTDGTHSADFITVNSKAAVVTWVSPLQIAVGVADPTQTNTGAINVTLNTSALSVISADPGVTVQQLAPQIQFTVNVSGSMGKSYQVVFSAPTNAMTWDANGSGSGPQDGSGTWDSSSPNWWYGSTNAAWNDTNPLIANFGVGGTAGTVTVSGAHTNQLLLFNPVTNGNYTFSGTGSLVLSNGVLANYSASLNVPLILPVSQTWTVASNQTVSLGSSISLPTPPVLWLAGGGAVRLAGGNNQLPASATVGFADEAMLDLGGNSQTLAGLAPTNGVTGLVANGKLTISGSSGFSPFAPLTSSACLDLSGLAQFTFNQSGQSFIVQGTAANSGSFNLFLAGSNGVNNITAANVYVGNGGGSGIPTGNLYLGRSNIFNCNLFQLGAYRGSGNIYFRYGLANSNVTFRGASGGSSRLGTMTVLSQSSGASQTGTLNLGAANVDALIGTLDVLNTVQPGIAETASFIFGNGTLDVTTLRLAVVGGSGTGTQNETATFTQNGGTAKVQSLLFGANTGTGTPLFMPTYNLAAGATLAAQTITATAGVPYNPASGRNLNLNGGTLTTYDTNTDLAISGADPTSGGALNLVLGAGTTTSFDAGAGRTITLQTNAPVRGSGNVNKIGAGTLVLAGTNSYTGTTLVSAGTLLVNGTLGTNALTVASTATLGGSGALAGTVTVQSGGTLQAGDASGAGTLTVSNLNLGASAGATTTCRVNVMAGGLIAAGNVTVAGTNIINITGSSLPVGTYTLITCGAPLGGVGIAGFKLGSVPALPSGATATLVGNGNAVQLVVTQTGTLALLPVGNPKLAVGDTLLLTNSVADSTQPPQRLLFSLVGGPAGATINATNGVVTWTAPANSSGSNFLFTVAVTQVGWQTNLLPVADAYVRDGTYSNLNYGASNTLAVKYFATANSGNSRESYLRFPLSGIPGTLASAQLQLTPSSASYPGVEAVALVTNDAWNENTLVWTNKPASGAPLATWTPALGTPVQLDLTAVAATEMAGDGLLSLRLFGTNQTTDGLVTYGSKEGAAANAPQLLVTSTNNISLSATQSFYVSVLWSNQPPVFPPVADTSLIAGASFALAPAVTDPNPQPQDLLFTLLAGPAGAGINPTNGLVSWRPTLAQAGTTNLFTVAVTQNGWHLTLPPQADTYVRDGAYSNVNYGSSSTLAVKYYAAANSGFSRESYLCFPLTGIPGTLASAKLQLTPLSLSYPGIQAVALVTKDAWSQSTLTWANKPASGAALATWTPSLSQPVLADVTGVAANEMAGDGLLSLRVYGTNQTVDGLVTYGSDQGAPAAAPQLFLVCTNSSSLSSTQSFWVVVSPPPAPVLELVPNPDGTFSLNIDGANGPDYTLQVSTNLSSATNWSTVFSASAPTLPFQWTDPDTNAWPQKFYRVLLGP